jgi:hypothetical protein
LQANAKALREALVAAVAVGRGDLAEHLGACSVARDPATVAAVTEHLSTGDALQAVAACRALGAAGPESTSALNELAALLTTDNEVLVRAALDALPRIDREGRTAKRVAALLGHEKADYCLLAADALAALGPPAAPVALPVIEQRLKPLEAGFLRHGGVQRNHKFKGMDQVVAARLVYTCGKLGPPAVPLLRRLAEATIRDDDMPIHARSEILGALAAQGTDAVKVAVTWAASDTEEHRGLAYELIEHLVRRGTPADVLEPFCGPLLRGDSPSNRIRAAEWLLRVDASRRESFEVLVELCEGKDVRAEIRGKAAETLSGQVCLPHNRMTDEVRRRGVKAVMSVIRAGHATERTLCECHGMAPFISQEETAVIDAKQNN